MLKVSRIPFVLWLWRGLTINLSGELSFEIMETSSAIIGCLNTPAKLAQISTKSNTARLEKQCAMNSHFLAIITVDGMQQQWTIFAKGWREGRVGLLQIPFYMPSFSFVAPSWGSYRLIHRRAHWVNFALCLKFGIRHVFGCSSHDMTNYTTGWIYKANRSSTWEVKAQL